MDPDRWQPWPVEQVATLFAEAPFHWWIGGGHALELHLGTAWRRHDDLDVGVCRYQITEMFRCLDGWELWIAAAGRLAPWDGRPLDAGRRENNVWARESPDAPWRFDVTVGSGGPREWVYRRDESITRPWGRAVLSSASGIRYLAPDLQLLFKSKDPRPKDHVDADHVIPVLDSEERRFLADHLPPGHPWLTALAR